MATQIICDYCEEVIPTGGGVPFGVPLNIVGTLTHEAPDGGVVQDVRLSITIGGWNKMELNRDLCRKCFDQIFRSPEYKGRA